MLSARLFIAGQVDQHLGRFAAVRGAYAKALGEASDIHNFFEPERALQLEVG